MTEGLFAALGAVPWRWVFALGCVAVPLVYWTVAIPWRETASPVRPEPEAPRDPDTVALAVRAIESGRFSPLLRSARKRLNAEAVVATGRTLADQPGFFARLRRPPRPAGRKVRRLARRLRRLERRTAWSETRGLPRLDPWRTASGSRRAMAQAVVAWLDELDRLSTGGTSK